MLAIFADGIMTEINAFIIYWNLLFYSFQFIIG